MHQMNEPAIEHHPVLGELRWDKQLHWWETEVELLPGHSISFCLNAEKAYKEYATPMELFPKGVAYLEWARSHEGQCRNQIAEDLLDTYNTVWANTDPNDPDDDPGPKNRQQFLAAISPGAIHLDPDGSATWYYDDGEEYLFGGHSIEVFAGKDGVFSDGHLIG